MHDSAKQPVFMFPGQSSCYPSMLEKLVELHAPGRQIIAEASDTLGRDIAAHYRSDNPDIFARNRDVQIGMFLANHLFLRILEAEGIRADFSLGLSLGEWNHLVHIDAVDFDDALLAVEERGRAYDDGPRGIMAAIFPIDLEELEQSVVRARNAGVVEVVNLNSPRQQVVAGEPAAVDELLRILDEETYVNAVVIEKHVPMHSSMFEPVGHRFAEHLGQVSFRPPRSVYLPNRLGEFVTDPSRDAFVDLLSTHVHRPVLWRQSVDRVVDRWPEAILIEVGPKQILGGMLGKKWHRKVPKFSTDSQENTAANLRKLVEDVRALTGTFH